MVKLECRAVMVKFSALSLNHNARIRELGKLILKCLLVGCHYSVLVRFLHSIAVRRAEI